MIDLVVVALLGLGTALATGLGAIPVAVLGDRAPRSGPLLLGLAAGVMTVAAVVGLLLPAIDEGSGAEVAAGCVAGALFLLFAERVLKPDASFMGKTGAGARSSALVFMVLAIHSLPEGFAVGSAYASGDVALGVFVIAAIAIQNIPEGTAVAVPMQQAGFGFGRQFWAAVGTSLPQPLGAVIAYLAVNQVSALLPVSFAFAAGAMLTLVLIEVLPDAYKSGDWRLPSAGLAAGAALMLGMSAALGV